MFRSKIYKRMDAENFPGQLKIGSRIVHRVLPHTLQPTADPFTCRAAVLIPIEGDTGQQAEPDALGLHQECRWIKSEQRGRHQIVHAGGFLH